MDNWLKKIKAGVLLHAQYMGHKDTEFLLEHINKTQEFYKELCSFQSIHEETINQKTYDFFYTALEKAAFELNCTMSEKKNSQDILNISHKQIQCSSCGGTNHKRKTNKKCPNFNSKNDLDTHKNNTIQDPTV